MSIEILTPVSTAKAVELSRGRFKKQILPLTSITYGGAKKNFDLAYCAKVVDAFKRGAYPYMPVKLAPADNAHTQDVLRTGGRLVDLELSKVDGLVATLELNEDGAKAVELSDGELPVSVRLVEGLTHSDGSRFDVALHHVLLTDDPNIRDMKPWEKVDLSAETREDGVTETINLSAERFTEGTMTDTKTVTLELTAEQADAMKGLLAEQEELTKLGLTPEQFVDIESDDEEAEDGVEKPAPPAPAVVGLTAEATRAIELANADASTARAEAAEMTRKWREAEVGREITEWTAMGLVPSVLSLARPALDAPSVIELSGGQKTDAATIVRNVLNEVIELAKRGEDVIELGKLSGILDADPDTEATQLAGSLEFLSAQFD
jgi:hypothetical protein